MELVIAIASLFLGMLITISTATTDIKYESVVTSNKLCETNNGVKSITAFTWTSSKIETKCMNGAKFMTEVNK